MQLKNKTEREQFLANYKTWGIWKEIPELKLKFYRYELPNGTVIIATEYACMEFVDYTPQHHFKYKKSTAVRYHLILDKKDKFDTGYSDTSYKLYNPSGDSKSSIIDYLTKTKPEIEQGDV